MIFLTSVCIMFHSQCRGFQKVFVDSKNLYKYLPHWFERKMRWSRNSRQRQMQVKQLHSLSVLHGWRYGELHPVSSAESSLDKPVGQEARIGLMTLVSFLVSPLRFWVCFWPFLSLFLIFFKEKITILRASLHIFVKNRSYTKKFSSMFLNLLTSSEVWDVGKKIEFLN